MSFYDDASLIMFPSGYKEDKIYSLKPTDGSGDLTFTRASTATRVNSDGLIENAFVLGSELVTNGDFATDTDWTKTSTVTISSGNAHIISDGSYQYLAQNTILTIGKKYKITYEIIENTLGLLKSNTTFGVTALDSSVGVHTFEAVAANASLLIERVSSCNIKIDNVSVKEVITLDVPRIDYTGGGCGKLLLEPQRTNTLLNSEDLNSWLKLDTSVTVNTTTSPNGTTNADTVTATGAGSLSHLIYQNLAFTSGTAYTLSVFAKANTSNFIQLVFAGNLIANSYANFDLSSGTITASAFVTAKIENYGNGWYRCSISATAGASSTNSQIVYLINSGTASRAQSFTASGESVYLWGGSFENGSYPTSYIPTTSTAVTRLADAASKTGISSLIGATEGTMFVECSALADDATNRRITISDGTANNRIYISYKNYTNQLRIEVISAGSSVFDSTYTIADITQTAKIAAAYKLNDFAFYVNGVQAAVDTSGAVPTSMSVFKFEDGAGGNVFFGKVNQAILFPTRLTNAELATLTTL